jgi:hypothetical protein
MSDLFDVTAREDFSKARTREVFSRILHTLSPQKQELLSLNEVRSYLKPRKETYRGVRPVPVDRIIGSEGRYRDFNKGFLPKRDALRGRWTSIDKAHLQDVILPPIRLYEIGGVYFVRDGNHRVSVARAQGVQTIDAEISTLDSEIEIDPGMTSRELKQRVIAYEKEKFYKSVDFARLSAGYDLNFTETGRYDEVLKHIEGHKYFLDRQGDQETPFDQSLRSWFERVFKPIVDTIRREGIIARFPGRTVDDLYVWIVKHWHFLKEQCGPEYPAEEAARDFADRFGVGPWRRFLRRIGIGRSKEEWPDNPG